MRVGAEWAYLKGAVWDEPADDLQPTWLGIGFITAEGGGIILLVALILAASVYGA